MSTFDLRCWLGIGGVAPDDAASAHRWARQLRWPLTLIALLALPALWFDLSPPAMHGHPVGRILDELILVAFTAELLWMMRVSRQPLRYVLHNWLDLVIIGAAAASLFGVESEWIALARLMRVVWASLLLARTLGSVRALFHNTDALWILAAGGVMLALSGLGFYWLEPTVHSYGEGLWLAFVTGATVGYGDFVPTTTASRFFAMFTVLLGFGMLSLTTASIAAFFIGEEEKKMRREMHHDIRQLREEVTLLRIEIRQLHDVLANTLPAENRTQPALQPLDDHHDH